MAQIHILNGPNLNLLGTREPEIYGRVTLQEIERLCRERVEEHTHELVFKQSNHEGQLVDWIQEAATAAKAIIINPAAYSHTSVAIHDALKATRLPLIEVHLSNIHAREEFRNHSYISPIASGVICGFGPIGYILAIDAAAALVD